MCVWPTKSKHIAIQTNRKYTNNQINYPLRLNLLFAHRFTTSILAIVCSLYI